MRSKKIKLTYNTGSFSLFGIASSEDDYHVAWLINRALSINLSRKKDTQPYGILNYIYRNDSLRQEFILINNKDEFKKMVPELVSVDYILKISGDLTNNEMIAVPKLIRSVKEITACIPIQAKKQLLYNVFNKIQIC